MNRTQWEYEVYTMNPTAEHFEDVLPRFGIEGWELIALHNAAPFLRLIFKRASQ